LVGGCIGLVLATVCAVPTQTQAWIDANANPRSRVKVGSHSSEFRECALIRYPPPCHTTWPPIPQV
jgi:hypothetical protein